MAGRGEAKKDGSFWVADSPQKAVNLAFFVIKANKHDRL